MTTYYVGPGGLNSNDGTSWALRKATLNGAEDIPVAAGDIVYVAPGVYREQLTVDVSGGNTYSTGTVSVTNGSATVTGSGTTFSGNVFAGGAGFFHVQYAASGTDGVTAGDGSFSSVAGNFQAGHVGMPIQLATLGAYVVATVTDTDNITISDPTSKGWPTTTTSVVYTCMSGQGAYEIASVDSNTQLTLTEPWDGPTLSGVAYLTFKGIVYVGDVTGINTDGVGGVVCVTGSNNDLAASRAYCISAGVTKDYRAFQGFSFYTNTTHNISIIDDDYWVIRDCVFGNLPYASGHCLYVTTTSTCHTVSRCVFVGQHNATAILFSHTSAVDNAGHVVSNCLMIGGSASEAIGSNKIGGVTIRNCTMHGYNSYGVYITAALTVGQCVALYNNIIDGCTIGLRCIAANEMIENYNALYAGTLRLTTVAGANSISSVSYPDRPILLSGFSYPWPSGTLLPWSQTKALAGFQEPSKDLYGIKRPTTSAKKSWGAIQFQNVVRDTTTKQAGAASLKITDAGRHQIWVPTTNTGTTISVYCYREASYAGTNPQMVIKQPGQTDRTTTDAGAAAGWNQLSDTFTPAASPGYVVVELVSNNTAAGVLQVETATCAGTITKAGNAKAIVTAADMTNTPKTITFAVALNDTATLVGGKLRTALQADPDVYSFFLVSGATTDAILTCRTVAGNDTTMNIATDNVTCEGLTKTDSSADTTAGVGAFAVYFDTLAVS